MRQGGGGDDEIVRDGMEKVSMVTLHYFSPRRPAYKLITYTL